VGGGDAWGNDGLQFTGVIDYADPLADDICYLQRWLPTPAVRLGGLGRCKPSYSARGYRILPQRKRNQLALYQRDGIGRSILLAVYPVDDIEYVALPAGDSGCGVFCSVLDRRMTGTGLASSSLYLPWKRCQKKLAPE
jgi:hypothetical protein